MNTQVSTISQHPFNLIVVLGPTASGKTSLGVKLAKQFKGEIISADSRQVYRGMDIGSGKDLDEYGATPYHLIDIVDPGYEFNVFEFQKRFCDAFSVIQKKHHLPFLVGGTGLYLESVLCQYQFTEVPINTALRETLASQSDEALINRLKTLNPNLHNTTDILDRERLVRALEIAEAETRSQKPSVDLPTINPLIFGIKWDRAVLKQRITKRLKQRMDNGLIEEVERLHKEGVSWESLHFYGLEYRFVASYLKGELNKNDMFQKLNSAIHTFSKQQEKWFRRMERKGTTIHWLDGQADPHKEALEVIASC
ncbi:tRNA (adenosine(37)-N6)-dimethylallyltransferase MiaA [Alkalimarinus alittae]|uniref:tRNA dimethylallyltransferase n=1 Tax=Alkalimarinus alittae TaxID=2961619 RepID=A0ABY6N053_9ALTE|nr:tRNA (adenosine(37)-N6)-dimethylallyltransferase MiaA [Alkalimarinus alittae]UZE95481.1 tRNA (adenosine(37)-N6)-dimethylallyltransferase MiaA [Alkalimarinus alittae]